MDYDFEHGSFYDRHPVLAIIAIVSFVVIGLIPAIAMVSKPVACALNASETWCPETINE